MHWKPRWKRLSKRERSWRNLHCPDLRQFSIWKSGRNLIRWNWFRICRRKRRYLFTARENLWICVPALIWWVRRILKRSSWLPLPWHIGGGIPIKPGFSAYMVQLILRKKSWRSIWSVWRMPNGVTTINWDGRWNCLPRWMSSARDFRYLHPREPRCLWSFSAG